MKKEILDFRTLVAVVLVVASLLGQKWSSFNTIKSDAQNLNFINQSPNDQKMVVVVAK